MTSLLVGYLLGLFYFAANQSKIACKKSFRIAWILFVLIPINNFFFMFFRLFNVDGRISSTRTLALVNTWADGIVWLLLGISIFFLFRSLLANESINTEQKDG